MEMIVVYLTCKDNFEAEKISEVLLSKKLIACVKKIPVNSQFLWKRKLDNADEVLLLLETIEEMFEPINKEVSKLHSYEIPLLFSVKVSETTSEVKNWLKEEL